MTVAYLDTIAAVAAFCAMYFLLHFSPDRVSRPVKYLLVSLVVLNASRNLSNALEWFGITAAIDPFEDYFEILIPVVWSMALLSYAQGFREREMHIERTNFQAFFDSISDLAFILNNKMEIMHVNPSAQSRLGYARDQLIKKHLRDLLIENDTQTIHTEKVKIQMTGESHLECTMRTQNGSSIPVEMKLSQGVWNGLDAVFCVSRDIAERRAMELRLRQAEKMDVIGQMAGGIAHDFNNQLLGIMGYAELLVHSTKKNPKEHTFAKNLLVSATHAAEITRRLLEFARQGTLHAGIVNLHKLVHEVSAMLVHSIDKRITISHRLNATQQTTKGDASQIQSVILNIALNARDAMTDGGELSFSTEEIELDKSKCRKLLCPVSPGSYLRLQIADSGIGMDKETMSRIFEPFFTTKDKGHGTGMGMVAVYNSMKNHNGSIEVSSIPGRGTTIGLYFPIVTEQKRVDDMSSKHSTDSLPDTACRVLLVDDEDVVRQVATELLTEIGCTVSACVNGKEAVAYYTDHVNEIDVVLLDIMMPEMGGQATFSKIREINPSAKVIASSGHAIDSITREMLEQGLNGFLKKPYRHAELAEKIRDIWQKEK